jgi:hypothetical protein
MSQFFFVYQEPLLTGGTVNVHIDTAQPIVSIFSMFSTKASIRETTHAIRSTLRLLNTTRAEGDDFSQTHYQHIAFPCAWYGLFELEARKLLYAMSHVRGASERVSLAAADIRRRQGDVANVV